MQLVRTMQLYDEETNGPYLLNCKHLNDRNPLALTFVSGRSYVIGSLWISSNGIF